MPALYKSDCHEAQSSETKPSVLSRLETIRSRIEAFGNYDADRCEKFRQARIRNFRSQIQNLGDSLTTAGDPQKLESIQLNIFILQSILESVNNSTAAAVATWTQGSFLSTYDILRSDIISHKIPIADQHTFDSRIDSLSANIEELLGQFEEPNIRRSRRYNRNRNRKPTPVASVAKVFYSKPKLKQQNDLTSSFLLQNVCNNVIANADTGTTGHFISMKDCAAILDVHITDKPVIVTLPDGSQATSHAAICHRRI